MQAGVDRDALAGHQYFSAAGLRMVPIDEVRAIYAHRDLFEGYRNVQVESFRIAPRLDASAPETAVVVATVHYAEGPSGRIDATLDLEQTGWRLRSIALVRSGGTLTPVTA